MKIMEFEKEPFKIKFSTVGIVILILFIIIGILSFNFRRLDDQLEKASTKDPNEYGVGLSQGLAGINDYDYFSENYKTAMAAVASEEKTAEIIKYAPDAASLGIASVSVDNLGDAYLSIPQSSPLYSKYGKLTKIASNVLDAEICHVGNGDWYEVYFIGLDGVVSKLVDSSNRSNGITLAGDLSLEKVPGLNSVVKIVTITNESAEEVAFIDINGNMFDQSGKAFE